MFGTYKYNIGTRDNKDKTTHYGCPHPHSPIPLGERWPGNIPSTTTFGSFVSFANKLRKTRCHGCRPGGSAWQGEIMTFFRVQHADLGGSKQLSSEHWWSLLPVADVCSTMLVRLSMKTWRFVMLGGDSGKTHGNHIYIYSLWFHIILSVPLVNIDFAGLVISIGPRVGFLLTTSIEYHWSVSILLL